MRAALDAATRQTLSSHLTRLLTSVFCLPSGRILLNYLEQIFTKVEYSLRNTRKGTVTQEQALKVRDAAEGVDFLAACQEATFPPANGEGGGHRGRVLTEPHACASSFSPGRRWDRAGHGRGVVRPVRGGGASGYPGKGARSLLMRLPASSHHGGLSPVSSS